MNANRTSLRAFLLLGLVMLFWAGNSIVGRAVRDDIPPFTLAFGRWLIALIVLLPFALPLLRREWRTAVKGAGWILLLGFVGIACFNALLYKGLHYSTAANALLLQAAIPSLVLLLDFALFRVRVPRLQVAGVALSTLGVVVIVFRADLAALLQLRLGMGELLIFCAVAAWAAYTVLLRKRPEVSLALFVMLTFAIGTIAMAPLAAMEAAAGQHVRWSWPVIAAFAYVGIFPSALAYFIYNRATAELGAARAGQAITLMPLFGAILSALLLGETLHGYHFAGMAMILAGIVLSMLANRQQAR